MTVESATFISDLNPLNPAGPTAISQGDDHLRLIKSTLRTTLPGLTGPVTVSHTQINNVVGNMGAITGPVTATQGQLNAGAALFSASGAAAASGTGFGVVPPGAIMMWASLTAPTGWAICDGSSGTPDLRSSFVRGASVFTPPGPVSGAHITQTTTITDPLVYALSFIMKL